MHDTNQALASYVLGLADDALIIGQRLSEWCGKGPFLEEDLALSNVSLDFIGRAQMLYEYASQLDEQNRTADQLAFLRDIREYKNTLIHELPIGDFAYTMVRQFLLDVFNVEFLNALTKSSDQQLAAIAGKAIKESRYHLRRSQQWMLRLGDGTDQSHQRTQVALEQLWVYTQELFTMSSVETALLEAGISIDKSTLLEAWNTQVMDTLSQATLEIPNTEVNISGGRDGVHTEHLGYLLAELQYLQRAYPDCDW